MQTNVRDCVRPSLPLSFQRVENEAWNAIPRISVLIISFMSVAGDIPTLVQTRLPIGSRFLLNKKAKRLKREGGG